MMREIMEVPFPLAASRRLISFLTFQISIYAGMLCQSRCFVHFCIAPGIVVDSIAGHHACPKPQGGAGGEVCTHVPLGLVCLGVAHLEFGCQLGRARLLEDSKPVAGLEGEGIG
jgi:hypothetical protein